MISKQESDRLYENIEQQYLRDMEIAELVNALKETLIPLIRLGDFIGNEDKGGASGLGPFDRCAIIGRVRAAISKAEVTA